MRKLVVGLTLSALHSEGRSDGPVIGAKECLVFENGIYIRGGAWNNAILGYGNGAKMRRDGLGKLYEKRGAVTKLGALYFFDEHEFLTLTAVAGRSCGRVVRGQSVRGRDGEPRLLPDKFHLQCSKVMDYVDEFNVELAGKSSSLSDTIDCRGHSIGFGVGGDSSNYRPLGTLHFERVQFGPAKRGFGLHSGVTCSRLDPSPDCKWVAKHITEFGDRRQLFNFKFNWAAYKKMLEEKQAEQDNVFNGKNGMHKDAWKMMMKVK
jgi:hypothetical protein